MKKSKKSSARIGAARRWTQRLATLMGIILFVVIVGLTFVVRYFTYNSVEKELTGYAQALPYVYETQAPEYSADFLSFATDYVESMGNSEIQAAAVDYTGAVRGVSQGTTEDYQIDSDFSQARANDGWEKWIGTLKNGEYSMVVTKVAYNSSGQPLGAVRYVKSLSGATQKVLWSCILMTAAGIVLLLVVIVFSSRFVKRLLAPLKEITFTANKIAQGDFNIRMEKVKDDEIGELCDTINDMAVSLDTAENMKNDFISSVSHELRTPLTAIKGWAETMQGGDIDQQTFDRGIGVIIRESERLSGIVEELLDFSRMQNGKMKTNMCKTDLLGELGEAVYMFTDRAKAEHKFLLYEAPKSLSPIYGDINRLRQVFVNIIDNALKYTDEGGTVNVSAKEQNGFIYIIVADNGCGIPAEHLPNVRRKFYKANQTIRGSGIGLALADEIMALHAGGLEIESRENLGTAVTISIPTYENLQRQKQKMHK